MTLPHDIAIATSAYRDLPLQFALRRIAELAAAAEIISYGPHSLLELDNARAAAKAGIPFSVHGPFASGNLGNPSEPRRRAAIELHRRHLKIAAMVGAVVYVVHPDQQEAPGPRSDQVIQALQRSFAELRGLQEALGVLVVVENMPLPELSHYTAPGDLDLCGLGLALDAGHAALRGNLQAWITDPQVQLRHVHLHDNPGPGSSDAHQPLGTGVVDTPAVLAAARAAGVLCVLEHTNEADVLASLTYLEQRGLLG
jgi:sugar phosphate isomerase/epimerase